MGYWGFKPFQNDYALDKFGGFDKPENLQRNLVEEITNNGENILDATGLLLSSLGYYSLISKTASDKLNKSIQTGEIQFKTDELLSEVLPMFITSLVISIDVRKELIIRATKNIKEIISRANLSDNVFNANGLYIIEAREEEDQAYQEIYNLAVKAVNSNFKDMNALKINDKQLNQFINVKNNEMIPKVNNYLNNRYKGCLLLRAGSNINILIRDKKYVLEILDDKQLMDLSKELQVNKIKVTDVSIKEYFDKLYPNGFYWHKSNLVSIDNKLPIKGADGDDFRFTGNEVRALQQHITIFDTKIKYEMASINKQKALMVGRTPVAEWVCIHKIYKGSKVHMYELKSRVTGNIIKVHAEQLKKQISNKEIYIENMKLTSDGRLITSHN